MPFTKVKLRSNQAKQKTSPPKPQVSLIVYTQLVCIVNSLEESLKNILLLQDEFLQYYLQNRNPNSLDRHQSTPWNQLIAGREGINVCLIIARTIEVMCKSYRDFSVSCQRPFGWEHAFMTIFLFAFFICPLNKLVYYFFTNA